MTVFEKITQTPESLTIFLDGLASVCCSERCDLCPVNPKAPPYCTPEDIFRYLKSEIVETSPFQSREKYRGCGNCVHQPEPLTMCDWGKHRKIVERICSGWHEKETTR